MRVIIIGGGISGLAAAWYLQKKNISYMLLESSDRLGGKIKTERSDGFIIEGGPDSFLTQKPWVRQLSEELGIASELLPCNAEKSTVYILKNGKLHPMPKGFHLAAPTRILPFLFTRLLSLRGKLRALLEVFIPAKRNDKDESLAAFLHRRFGKEITQTIAGPLMSGIYSGDPEKLSLQCTFPLFPEMERKYGSLSIALRSIRKKSTKTPAPMFTSFKNGMQTLVDALQIKLEGPIKLKCKVTGIEKLEKGFEVITESERLKADALILTTPSFITAELLRTVSSELADKLNRIAYSSTANVSLAFKHSDLWVLKKLDGFGFIVPEREVNKYKNLGASACPVSGPAIETETRLSASTCCSVKFNHRAPENMALWRVFLSDITNQSKNELAEIAIREIRSILSVDADPVFIRVHRWPKSNPQYHVGHSKLLEEIEEITRSIPGLQIIGSAYRGVSVPDLIHDAERTMAEN